MQKLVFASAIVAVAMASPAAAQLVVAAITSGEIDGVNIPSSDCGQSFVVGVPASCVRAGSSGNFFQAVAVADEGGALRGLAYAAADGSQLDRTRGSSGASWTERVFFNEQPEPIFGFLEIEMRGVQSTLFTGSGFMGAWTATFMQMGIYRDGMWASPESRDEIFLVRRLDDYGGYQSHYVGRLATVRGVDGPFERFDVGPGDTVFPFTLVFELDPGSSFYDWNWRFVTSVAIEAGASGFAFADYSSTFVIRSVGFRNQAGADITRFLDVSFASGASYPLSAIPEPATWAMLIAGFGLTGLAARRRQREALQV